MSEKTAIFIENFEKLKEKTSHYDTNEIALNLCIALCKPSSMIQRNCRKIEDLRKDLF